MPMICLCLSMQNFGRERLKRFNKLIILTMSIIPGAMPTFLLKGQSGCDRFDFFRILKSDQI